MNWMHSIVDDPAFQAPWTALDGAIHMAHEVGTSAALRIETLQFGRSHSCHRRVRFEDEVQLRLDHDESQRSFAFAVSEGALQRWSPKPWALDPKDNAYFHSHTDFHADPQSSAMLISKACDIDIDSISFMQLNVPQQTCRNELPGPAWLSIAAHNVEARAFQAPLRNPPPEQPDDVLPGGDVDIDPSSTSSSSHISQFVCLFHLQDPPVFGRIDWTDYHVMMHEAALLLNIDDDALLGLVDIAHPLGDLPQDVTPLIAHIAGDLDPGEPRSLGIADIEIHANVHEGHYFTAPVVDRAVYAFPITTDRRGIFQTVDVETYCRLENHRCLLYHNGKAVVTHGNPRLELRPGDYLRIMIPHPESCGWSTQRLLQFYRQLDDADEHQSSRSSPRSGYSPSLVPSEELRAHLGLDDPDHFALLQTSTMMTCDSSPCSSEVAMINAPVKPATGAHEHVRLKSTSAPHAPHEMLSRCDGVHCGDQWSFTEEFLRAVRLMQDTVDNIHTQVDDANDIQGFAPWVQEIHHAWSRLATLGPGGAEMLGRLETWFTDHYAYQRCYNSRVAILGPDFENWEMQIKRLWRERLLPEAPIEFHLIYPPPDDRAEQTIGQLMIVQRPAAFQRSVLVSVHDSAYDQGRAHSLAIVLGDRVDIQSVQTMLEANEDCPPEVPQNLCTLFFGTRQFQPHERAFARHGHAFRFLIHRRLPHSLAGLANLDDPELRQHLQLLIGSDPSSPRHELALTAPEWFHALQTALQRTGMH